MLFVLYEDNTNGSFECVLITVLIVSCTHRLCIGSYAYGCPVCMDLRTSFLREGSQRFIYICLPCVHCLESFFLMKGASRIVLLVVTRRAEILSDLQALMLDKLMGL